jgi:hypothetical protein
MNARVRQSLSAMTLLGVCAFWGGLWMAGQRYPSGYDWRYMTLSSLLYADRNPNGYPWAWGGLMLCALGGLCWTTVLMRHWRPPGTRRRPVGIWALGLGYVCMVCALLPSRLLPLPKGHEILALSAFIGLCIGIVQLTFQAAECSNAPRACAGFLAGAALSPVLLAGAAPAYVSYALPQLPWVGPEWRARGVPVYLSFAFWEWATCAVFSAYTVSLCLATRRMSNPGSG